MAVARIPSSLNQIMQTKRSRIVSFRLSDEEYESLKSTSVSRGARSVSDFTRSVACNIKEVDDINNLGKIDDTLSILNEKIDKIGRNLRTLEEEMKAKALDDFSDSDNGEEST